MHELKRPLKVFLSHAHSDADTVRALYERLTADGVDAWLDKEKLLPGQDWELEIRKAVREADVVVVCLSKQFNQAGYRQKEVRIALDEAEMQPEGTIFIIPARLEECDTLESLRKWHWVDLFEADGYEKLMQALQSRAKSIGAKNPSSDKSISQTLQSQDYEFPMPKINPLPDSLSGKIAFLRGKVNDWEYLITDSDGSDEFVMAKASWSIFGPRIAPDGEKLVFVSKYEGRASVYIINRDGTNLKRLTDPSGLAEDGYAAWSPDGNRLIYSREYSICNDIYVMDSSGYDQKNLTNMLILKMEALNLFSEYPWSPDGQRIVFSSDRDGTRNLYIMDISGENIHQITKNLETQEYGAVWAPNRNIIAYVSTGGVSGGKDIFTLNIDSPRAKPNNITKSPYRDTSPVWSPNGTQILFVSDRDSNDELYIMNSDGSNVRRITHTAEPENNPSWLR